MKKTNTKKRYEFSGADLVSAAKELAADLREGRVGSLRSTTLTLPAPVAALRPAEIQRIRTRLGASQAVFARLLNVPKRTAISWETGERRPSGAAMKLLDIASRRPEVLVGA